MNARHLEILQHSLGVDKYGIGSQYRNRYVLGSEGDSFQDCVELCSLGYMKDHGPQAIAGGMHCFCVTDSGKKAMAAESPAPPKLTRSAKRYRAFLAADCGMSFGEWLKHGISAR